MEAGPPLKQKVLIVDDSPTSLKVLGELLKADYAVYVATSGKAALEKAVADPPDLILLDIIMPDLDGYEVCRRLKAEESTKDIPVIFITAKSEEDDEVRGLALGAVDYITKPFRLPIVKARVQTHLKLHDYTMKLEQKGIEIEELYQQLNQELDKVRAIHERTLPEEIPGIKGLSMYAYYQPAQRIGGDFYNAIEVDNKLIIYVSDVSGHGMEGALLSVFVKEAIDSYITLKPQELEPEKILCHLNRQYSRENYPDDYFVCIFLMVLDLDSMELTYTGAGFQELPLVQMGNGKKMRLHTEGPPISSVIPEQIMDFTEAKIILSPGSTLLVNTDGISEQQTGEEQYNGRLEQVFYKHSRLPPEKIITAIKEDFYRFNGGSMQGDDDITLCIIQVGPKEKR